MEIPNDAKRDNMKKFVKLLMDEEDDRKGRRRLGSRKECTQGI